MLRSAAQRLLPGLRRGNGQIGRQKNIVQLSQGAVKRQRLCLGHI